jgi:2-oxoglutarate ferredoxin oxidoreductase subunit gamma
MSLARRGEVIFSGIGGGGVLLIGECVARAAAKAYRNVVWFPNYSAAVRGGSCECFVIFSDEPIASPVLSQVQTVVVLDPAQVKASEPRVRTGGTLIVESTGLSQEVERRDIAVLKVPALELARASGNARASNFIILGRYVSATRVIEPGLVEEDLATRFGGSREVLTSNLKAFRMGFEGSFGAGA